MPKKFLKFNKSRSYTRKLNLTTNTDWSIMLEPQNLIFYQFIHHKLSNQNGFHGTIG